MNEELQDKAWAALPKEFKEEVKNEYFKIGVKAKRSRYERDVVLCYFNIFGKHNLTSDTEELANIINKPQPESNNDETYFLAPRLQVAAAAMQGMLGNPNLTKEGHLNENRGYIAEYAVEYADALLQKLGINYENK